MDGIDEIITGNCEVDEDTLYDTRAVAAYCASRELSGTPMTREEFMQPGFFEHELGVFCGPLATTYALWNYLKISRGHVVMRADTKRRLLAARGAE